MKLKSMVSNLLKNKMVLNIVSIIALINVIGYMMLGEIDLVLFYVILAGVIKHFSHNMIIVLGVPLFLINMISLKKLRYSVEGMETKEKDVKETKKTEPVAEKKKKQLQKVSNDKNNDGEVNNDGVVSSNVSDEKSGFEVGRKKGGSKIDYAATIEESYDQLNKILGSDGIKNLTSDTQRLMQQQLDLSESMTSMKPLIEGIMPMAEKMQGMMKTMDGGESGGLGGIMDMAKKMSSGLTEQK